VALAVETNLKCHLLNLEYALHRRADFDFLWIGQRRWWWRGDFRRSFIGLSPSSAIFFIWYLCHSVRDIGAGESTGDNWLGDQLNLRVS
jgi:hypothetical protein